MMVLCPLMDNLCIFMKVINSKWHATFLVLHYSQVGLLNICIVGEAIIKIPQKPSECHQARFVNVHYGHLTKGRFVQFRALDLIVVVFQEETLLCWSTGLFFRFGSYIWSSGSIAL